MHSFYKLNPVRHAYDSGIALLLLGSKALKVLCILVLVFICQHAFAQEPFKIAANGKINQAIDISGTRAIFKVEAEDQTMRALIYELDSGEWQQTASLAPGREDFEVRSVAIQDKWAVVSGLTSVLVFEYNGESWVKNAELTGTDTQWDDEFGKSVAISGNQLIVGAPAEKVNGESSGAVYVYKYLNNKWVKTGKLTASDAGAYYAFGSSVAIEKGLAVVGAAVHQAAYVFEYNRDAESWQETTKLTGYKGDYSYFGQSVAIEGKRIFVGEPGANALGNSDELINGSVHVYEYRAKHWAKSTTIESPKGNDLTTLKENLGVEGDYFGTSLDVKDNKLVIGADRDNAVYIFKYNGYQWENMNEFSVTAPTDTMYVFGEQFGSKVAISGNNVIAASTYGSFAYTFEIEKPTPKPALQIMGPSKDEISVNIFPNPVAEVLNIHLNKPVTGEVQIQLLDQLGRLVYKKKVNVLDSKEILGIDLNEKRSIEAGTLFLTIQTPLGYDKVVRLVKK